MMAVQPLKSNEKSFHPNQQNLLKTVLLDMRKNTGEC
jgi:hypothetical protein